MKWTSMARLAFATLVLLAAAGPGLADEEPDVSPRRAAGPNIVLILADDLGWSDLGCYGNKRIKTANLDRLASQGMRFTDAYAAAPVCSPTRASILTGQAPGRLGITNHVPDHPSYTPANTPVIPPPSLNHLALEHVTIAERLRDAGYATALIGKWHLAGPWRDGGRGDPRFYPERQGFDLNIGGCAYGGPPTFFDPYGIHNLPPRKRGEYLPDRLADEAVTFLRDHRGADERFFLCLWTYQVHWPYEAPSERILPYLGKEGPGLKNPRYAAMVESLDTAVGTVLDELDALGLAEDTLVVFLSDNGGFTEVTDNRPLRGSKGYLYEGGIRVPMIVRWPKIVPEGVTCSVPVISTDLFPTFLAAAGEEPADGTPLDGEDLTPLLGGAASQGTERTAGSEGSEELDGSDGTGGLERDAIYFHCPSYAWHQSNRLGGAVRSGRFKLIERFDDQSLELYDLANDISESVNLASKEPERAAALLARLHAWQVEAGVAMPTPRDRRRDR